MGATVVPPTASGESSDFGPLGEAELIQQIRSEGGSLKECFTRYAFQTIIGGSAGIALVLRFGSDVPGEFITLPVLLMAAAVCRLGIHKYTSANRITGFQLHLERIRRLRKSSNNKCARQRPLWVAVAGHGDWEHAMRAWRVVQACVFQSVYRTPEFFIERRQRYVGKTIARSLNILRVIDPRQYTLRKEVQNDADKYFKINEMSEEIPPLTVITREKSYPWFMPGSLAESSGGNWYPGSYLRAVLGLLILLITLSFLPVAVSLAKDLRRVGNWGGLSCGDYSKVLLDSTCDPFLHGIFLGVAGFSALMFLLRIRNRRRILEEGLGTVHASAVMWQVVLLSDYIAFRLCGNSYRHYTEVLSRIAKIFVHEKYDAARPGDTGLNSGVFNIYELLEQDYCQWAKVLEDRGVVESAVVAKQLLDPGC